MPAFEFDRDHVLEAISEVVGKENGIEWLYQQYPASNGTPRKSRSGFVLYEGTRYPAKPLGRFASEIAQHPLKSNPHTTKFLKHFNALGFQSIAGTLEEAEEAVKRERRLAEVLCRREQARFRQSVLELFGYRCIISGCTALEAIEAAHIEPVGRGGSDKATNGLPLRTDLHRLFDAGLLIIDPETWTVEMCSLGAGCDQYHGQSLKARLAHIPKLADVAKALLKKNMLNPRSRETAQ